MSRNERLRLISISTGIRETFLIPDTAENRQCNYEPNCPFFYASFYKCASGIFACTNGRDFSSKAKNSLLIEYLLSGMWAVSAYN